MSTVGKVLSVLASVEYLVSTSPRELGDISVVVDDVSVIVLHPLIGGQSIIPDISQWLGEVGNILNNQA